MIFFMSNSGESLPVLWRLKRAGLDAGIYIHSPQYRGNYNGIVQKTGIDTVKKKLMKADLVIFDITRPNERAKHDAALLKTFGLKFSSDTVFGPVADKLKKHTPVIGASEITERLEMDRNEGAVVAQKMGFTLPEAEEFKTLTEGAKFLAGRRDLWVFKPHVNQDLDLTYVEKFPGELYAKMLSEYRSRIGDKCEYLLQKKIDGVEVSSEVWINEKGPAAINHTIENKRLMDADLGMAIGSQSNTVWLTKENNTITRALGKMADYLKSNGYTGPCDANCIVKDGVPYFLEWTPRFGYDAVYCLLTLSKDPAKFLTGGFESDFHGGYAVSQRISIPPYPYGYAAARSRFARDVCIMNDINKMPNVWFQDVYDDAGTLRCAGADGILGVVTARGRALDQAWGRLYHNISKLKVTSYLQYRTDGMETASKRIRRLKVA